MPLALALVIALCAAAAPAASWAASARPAAGARTPATRPKGRAPARPARPAAGKPAERPPAAGKRGAASTRSSARPAPPRRSAPTTPPRPAEGTRKDEETPTPAPGDPDHERITRLQQALASIVHGPVLGRLRVGIRVIDALTGRVFFRRRGPILMDPASNQKVLATTTALLRLGADWRFRTELVGPAPDADGVIAGPVVLRGSGDPSFRARDLHGLAAAVASRGVTRIDGGVLADARRIGSDETAPGERSPLRVGRSAVVVRVRPGERDGAPGHVSLRPESETFRIVNRTTTRRRGRSRVTASLSTTPDGKIVVTVAGRIAASHPGIVLRRTPPNHRLYAAVLLRSALIEAGIVVRDGAGLVDKGPPPGSALLALHESAPLGVIVRRINKDSDNEYADRLLDVVGAELYGGAATTAKGLRALREAMDELGIPAGTYVPTNGSGLGHGNRVSADTMADLLQRLYFDPRVGPDVLQSLSVGGVDGTTRNRFRGSPAAERVRSKTGTLNGKSCLSGYVGDGNDVLVFAILVEGLRGRRLSAVRGAQVNAVNAMMRYARGAVGEPASEEVEAPIDIEGAEPDESDEEEAAPEEPTATPPPVTSGGAGAAPAESATGALAPSATPSPAPLPGPGAAAPPQAAPTAAATALQPGAALAPGAATPSRQATSAPAPRP
jgi:D-alanyl-D-alanine carboxypeptidase/D-alanyl-D-alanine-endopeptidase (penicillin-binding protein 4)